MRILFLDIDGVLNSDAYFKKNEKAMEFGFSDAELLNHLDPEACARLQRLLELSGAKVVLSSSWRTFVKPEEMQRLLHARGVTAAELISETPKKWREAFDPDIKRGFLSPRGAEILEWLYLQGDRRPGIGSYVILDDAQVGEPQTHGVGPRAILTPRQVRTDYNDGLQDEHVLRALDLFNARGI